MFDQGVVLAWMIQNLNCGSVSSGGCVRVDAKTLPKLVTISLFTK